MVHGPPPSRARLCATATPIAARHRVLVFFTPRSLMSIHTEKPNPRLSTKPVTTPENAHLVVVARRVDGVRSRRTRRRRRRSDGVVHYRNGFASMASGWCRRGAIDATHPWRGLTQKASKLLMRTPTPSPRTNRRIVYSKVSCISYAFNAAMADAPTAWSVSRAFRSSSPCASMRSSVCCVCSLKASWI